MNENSATTAAPRPIVVLGSLNEDRFSLVPRLPRPGETLTGHRAFRRFGGKGANQALAAARLGGSVRMIGAIGADDAGAAYRQRLSAAGVSIEGLIEIPETTTGEATILVDDEGENCIVVVPGANGAIRPDHVLARRHLVENASALVLQLEIPLETVLEAIHLASAASVPVIFNPSPWRSDLPWGEMPLHTVIVNEGEAKDWLGAIRFPAEWPLERLIVTRGGDQIIGLTADERIEIQPPKVRPVDTVGAGDAFAGAVAVALAEGRSFRETLRFASAVGALATLREGAQEGQPTRAEVDALLSQD